MVKMMINVSAVARPDCNQILEVPAVRRISERIFGPSLIKNQPQPELMPTIRVPQNLLFLRLPPSDYERINVIKAQTADPETLTRKRNRELLKKNLHLNQQK
jgi:hypothetical protein